MSSPLSYAFIATFFTFLMTVTGSCVVFLFSQEIPDKLQRFFLGFAAGVMIAASIWSLLIPSMERADTLGYINWVPATIGFSVGFLFLFIGEYLLPHFWGDKLHLLPNFLLLFAITLHNIPEGMAVGLAWPLAIGIGIQNIPEGAAVAIPLTKNGISKTTAFLLASATGLVEPLFGTLAALVAKQASLCMPWLLSFAAGAMIYVVVEELIPETHLETKSAAGAFGILIGFLMMMILDVSLN